MINWDLGSGKVENITCRVFGASAEPLEEIQKQGLFIG